MPNIFISCGHNNARNWVDDHGKLRLSAYKDQGAVSGSDTEFKYSSKISKEIQKLWNSSSYQLVFVPEGLNLQDRIKFINSKSNSNFDLCMELHMDSATPSAMGCSTWYLSGSQSAQDKSIIFQKEYTRVTGISGRGVKGDLTNRLGRLAFVRDTKPLAFLLEMGFISNDYDRNTVWTKAAAGIVAGLKAII